MARARSLRHTLVAGLLVLQFVVLACVSVALYERARRIGRDALRSDVEVRARTLAGVLELDKDGHEFDLDPSAVEEYTTKGEPAFLSVVDSTGKVVVKSPSLGEVDFAPTSAWVEDGMVHEELTPGPYGVPCAAVTYSFRVRVDGGGKKKPTSGREPWTPPSEAEQRYRIHVAVGSRERDAALASLGWFLLLVDGVALLLTLGGGLLLARAVLRPVRRMTSEATRLDVDAPNQQLVPSKIVSELQTLAETLNDAFDRLRGALERQRRFVADAGHELRTPVSILMSNADVLLQRTRSPDEYVEGLELQRRTSERMGALVDDLLTLARVDSGGTMPRMTTTSVDALVTDLATEFEPVAAQRGVRLEVARGSEAAVRCDVKATLRVLRNLVSNGLKFTPGGGLVRVSVEVDATHVELHVGDSGPGIPAAVRERVFERFFRVQDGSDRNEGSGLGLAIARSLVDAQEGELTVGESPSGGALFVVRLRRGEGERGRGPTDRTTQSTPLSVS